MRKKSEIFEKNVRKTGFSVQKSKVFVTYKRKIAWSGACGELTNKYSVQNRFLEKSPHNNKIAKKNTAKRPRRGSLSGKSPSLYIMVFCMKIH